MTKVFLSLHVLAALIAIGPVAVAASMFPSAVRRAATGSEHDVAVLRTLHRICRVYAAVGVAIPFFGFATAGVLGVTGDAWVIASIVLTAAAAAVLAFVVLPRQQGVLDGIGEGVEPGERTPARLAMYTGIFNILWAVVTVLMIVRPGSTTSA